MINQGIAATVDDKVDAYRANPDALAQRAKGSQDLLDLLALQQVNKEKEAAKRQIQLNTQPPQDTILAQLEAEAVGRTKEDMVSQIGGIMQKDNQAQAKNMKQVGKEGAATPRQLAGVQQGLGQVASQINPNIARARAGGIVGFSNGGKVINRDSVTAIQEAIRNKDEQALAAMGLSLASFGGSTQIDSVTRVLEALGWESKGRDPTAGAGRSPLSFIRDQYQSARQARADRRKAARQRAAIGEPTDPDRYSYGPEAGEALPEPPPTGVSAADRQGSAAARAAAQGQGIAGIAGGAGSEESEYQRQLELAKDLTPGVQKLGPSTPVPSMYGIGENGKTSVDFVNQTLGLGTDGIAGLGLEGQKAATDAAEVKYRELTNLDANRADLRRLQAERADPQARERDRFIAGLLGAANKGHGALAGAGAASMQFRQRAADDEFNIASQLANFDIETGKGVMDAGRQAATGLREQQKTAAQLLGNITEAEYRRIVANQTDETKRAIENARAQTERDQQQSLNFRAIVENDRLTQQRKEDLLSTQLAAIQTRKSELARVVQDSIKVQLEGLQDRIRDLSINLGTGTDDQQTETKAEVERLEEQLRKLTTKGHAAMLAAWDQAGLLRREEDLVGALEEVSGQQLTREKDDGGDISLGAVDSWDDN